MNGRVKLAAVFSDHMVLQRGKAFPVWGQGADGAPVTVRNRGIERTAAVKDGRWRVIMPPQDAGEPCTLSVRCGDEEIVLEDVLFGDVWLAGGQSNMEWPLSGAKDGLAEAEAARDTRLRFYNVPKCAYTGAKLEEAERGARWQICTGEDAKDVSAVAYWFAKEIRAEVGVPVGIVGCNWGGTSAAAWMSRERLYKMVSGRSYAEDYARRGGDKSEEEYARDMAEFDRVHNAWKEKSDAIWAKNPKTPWRDIVAACGETPWPPPPGPTSPFRPSGLYETMLSRVAPLALKGFLYYQGEEDWNRSADYYDWMCALIGQWRQDFRDDELPFLFVQLPMYDTSESIENGWVSEDWPRLREAQLQVSRFVRGTGLAVIPDCGELDNIHPADKEPVGHRLALHALKRVYGREADADAPVARLIERFGSELRVTFDKPLELRGEGLFEVAGENGVYHNGGVVRVNGDTLTVSAEEVSEPCALRYAWRAYCAAPLYGANGLPVSPFRGAV
ncbi:MAG: sialate O-acetylesterase [Oscillospiraceae bacterium]|jgi:sialate O-acetylesterase|nr:sialate O-acetylesterase [Oscillospiraceae bacterium]